MDYGSTAVVYLACIMLLWHLLLIVVNNCGRRLHDLLDATRNSLRAMLCCKKWDIMEIVVEEAVHNRRIEHFQDLISTVRWIFSAVMLRIVYKRLAGGHLIQTSFQDGLLLVGYGSAILLRMCPWMLSKRTIDVWYSACMSIAVIYHTPFVARREHFLLANTYTMVFGGIASLGSLRWQIAVFWNLMAMFSALTATQVFEPDDDLIRMLYARALLTVGMCAYAFLVEARWREQAHKEIAAHLLRENHLAGNALMSYFYDLVIELDSTLTIATSGRDLARFLQCDIARSLEGTNFAQLLHSDEDQALFTARTHQSVNEQESTADVLHVTLRFAGHARQVELFTFKFTSIVGGRRFLVGIRDFGEQQGWQGQLPQPSRLLPSQLGRVSSNAMGDVGIAPLSFSVTVDTAVPDSPIIHCSPDFEHWMGFAAPAEGVMLADVIANVNEVERWIQTVMNMQISGEPEKLVQKANRCRVLLRPRGRQDVPSLRAAQCMLVLPGHEDAEEDSASDSAMLVHLTFSRWNHNKSYRRRVARSPTRANRSGSCDSSSSSSNQSSQGTSRVLERISLKPSTASI